MSREPGQRLRRQARADELLRHRRYASNTRSSGRETFESVAWVDARLGMRHPKTDGPKWSARRGRASDVRTDMCSRILAASFGSCRVHRRGQTHPRFQRAPLRGAGNLAVLTRGGARRAGLHPGLLPARPVGLKSKAPTIVRGPELLTHGRIRPTKRQSHRFIAMQELNVFLITCVRRWGCQARQAHPQARGGSCGRAASGHREQAPRS